MLFYTVFKLLHFFLNFLPLWCCPWGPELQLALQWGLGKTWCFVSAMATVFLVTFISQALAHPPPSCHTASALEFWLKASFVVIMSGFLWSRAMASRISLYTFLHYFSDSFSVIKLSFTFLLPQFTRQSCCKSLYLISPCDDFLLVMVEGVLWQWCWVYAVLITCSRPSTCLSINRCSSQAS